MKNAVCVATPPSFFELHANDGGVGLSTQQVDQVPNKSIAYVLVVTTKKAGKQLKYVGRLAKVEDTSLAPMQTFVEDSEEELIKAAEVYFRDRFSVPEET